MIPTILICTPDSQSVLYQDCLDSVCATTRGIPCEIITLDNRRAKDFNHAAEINKARSIGSNKFITLDDDVRVVGDWLPAMLEAARPDVGIVACSVWRDHRTIWSRAWTCDAIGRPRNWTGEITEPVAVPAACSCCWLINSEPGHFYNELPTHYWKYYFDPAYCFHLLEMNKQVITIPQQVLHLGAGQQRHNPDRVAVLDADRKQFVGEWIASGRLEHIKKLYSATWPEDLIW